MPFKDEIAAIQGALTCVALVLGVVWFWQRRQLYPRANLTQIITHRMLTERKILVRVSLQLKNEGLVLMRPSAGYVELCRIVPLPEHMVGIVEADDDPIVTGKSGLEWCQHARRELALSGHEIEPGELDEIHCDFVVESSVKTVMIESHIGNRSKRRWQPVWVWLLSKVGATRWKDYVSKLPKGKTIGWNAAALYDLAESQGEHDAGRNTSVAATA